MSRRDMPAEGSQEAASYETPEDERPVLGMLRTDDIAALARFVRDVKRDAQSEELTPEQKVRNIRALLVSNMASTCRLIELDAKLRGVVGG